MRRIVACLLLSAAGLSVGCGANRVSGDHIRQRNIWYGTLAISGDYNQITVARGSRLIKLSILGHHNEVTVEDGVTLNKIEIFGDRNTVRIPEQLIVRVNQAGKGNQIVRRPSDAGAERQVQPEAVAPVGAEADEPDEGAEGD